MALTEGQLRVIKSPLTPIMAKVHKQLGLKGGLNERLFINGQNSNSPNSSPTSKQEGK
jgi:hypothetical protein